MKIEQSQQKSSMFRQWKIHKLTPKIEARNRIQTTDENNTREHDCVKTEKKKDTTLYAERKKKFR